MANPFGLELSWEAIQTALMWARNRVAPPGAQASSAEKKEEPLKQQVTASILPTRDDEAILIAIDAALSKQTDGLNHLARIQQVREVLEPHQQTDWRKNLGSITMTERFEQMVASETIIESNRNGPDADDQGAPQRRRNGSRDQRRVERKFERRPIDYEWTDKDPRVQHLLLISGLVQATPDGVDKAKQYLLSAGFIKKQSTAQQAAAAAEQGSKAATRAIHRYVGNVKSTDARLEDIEDEETRDRYLENRSRQANARREVTAKRWKKYFRLLAILIILAIVAAALYNDLS